MRQIIINKGSTYRGAKAGAAHLIAVSDDEAEQMIAQGAAVAPSVEYLDARSQDVFAQALRSPTLVVAITVIMKGLRIVDRGTCDAAFTAVDAVKYPNLKNSYERARFLRGWLCDELDAAAERVGRDG
jgi:hypothetical protein